MLVIHGIGQQQPFRPLDNFVNNLRSTLEDDGKKVTATHLLFGREEVFDHAVRIEAFDPTGGAPDFQLDVYEFFWAPLTRGKASFVQVASWLLATGFTPLRRFAYNVPLLVRRAKTRRQLCVEFGRELWRVVYVPLAAAGLAVLAYILINQSTELAKKVPAALTPSPEMTSWSGAVKAVAALVATTAAIALLLSFPEQLRDLLRLRKRKPREETSWTAARAFQAGKTPLPGLLKDAMADAQKLWAKIKEYDQWRGEFRARILLVFLTPVALCIAVFVAWWLAGNFFRQVPTELWNVILVLGIAFLLKRAFVDYLADIALYTTADENSEFFKTRTVILKEATHRIRSLLRDPQYASVAIAGHSLGSVIAYDAIKWLRTEAQLPRGNRERDALIELGTLAQTLPTEQAIRANLLLDQLNRGLSSRTTDGELAKLTTFITFGSPLNKVLYFFRTKVKIYETVRSHIIQTLHGFRLSQDLLTRDPGIVEAPLTAIPDRLYWLNVSSPMDPVSAPLVFYDNVEERRRWYPFWGKCHLDYWHDKKFYREVLNAIRRGGHIVSERSDDAGVPQITRY
jgi:hypothetical protein